MIRITEMDMTRSALLWPLRLENMPLGDQYPFHCHRSRLPGGSGSSRAADQQKADWQAAILRLRGPRLREYVWQERHSLAGLAQEVSSVRGLSTSEATGGRLVTVSWPAGRGAGEVLARGCGCRAGFQEWSDEAGENTPFQQIRPCMLLLS